MSAVRSLVRVLSLPYESVRTVYEGDCEVRLYRNQLTGQLQVGKRLDSLGLESTIAVREGTWLQQIRHAHITPVYDVVEVSGYPAPMQVIELIMPWYERGSIFDALERGERFSIGEAIGMMSGALLGVAELHERQWILHRDLKSPNFLIADDGAVLVGDLGVAVSMNGDGTAEALPNARLYTAPETFVTRRSSRQSDIFGAGLVLHELVSGPLPYSDPLLSLDAIAARLAKGRPAVPPAHLQHAAWVPPRLRRVVNKALRLTPEARFASARQMIDALSKVDYVDWKLVVDEPDRKRWEGVTVERADRRFAVDAVYRPVTQRRKADGWTLAGLQLVTRWQRVRPDALVPDLSGAQAANFFDTMVAIATSR